MCVPIKGPNCTFFSIYINLHFMETFLEAVYNYKILFILNAHCNYKKYIVMLISEALIIVF